MSSSRGRQGRPIGLAGIAVLDATFAARRSCCPGCGSESDPPRRKPSASPARAIPGSTPFNTRHVKGEIDSSNVGDLAVAWTAPIPGTSNFGSYASTPVIDKGVIYSQDLASNVQALNLETGEVLWTRQLRTARHRAQRDRRRRGPRLRRDADRSLRPRPEKRPAGLVDATDPQRRTKASTWRPATRTAWSMSRPCRSTPAASTKAAASASLWALDAKTGKKRWHFDTVPKSLWGNPKVNSGGGLWYPPAFDGKGWHVLRRRQPGAVPGHRRSTPSARAVPAPTSTPTRWSSSTPRPASSTGSTR